MRVLVVVDFLLLLFWSSSYFVVGVVVVVVAVEVGWFGFYHLLSMCRPTCNSCSITYHNSNQNHHPIIKGSSSQLQKNTVERERDGNIDDTEFHIPTASIGVHDGHVGGDRGLTGHFGLVGGGRSAPTVLQVHPRPLQESPEQDRDVGPLLTGFPCGRRFLLDLPRWGPQVPDPRISHLPPFLQENPRGKAALVPFLLLLPKLPQGRLLFNIVCLRYSFPKKVMLTGASEGYSLSIQVPRHILQRCETLPSYKYIWHKNSY